MYIACLRLSEGGGVAGIRSLSVVDIGSPRHFAGLLDALYFPF